MSAVDYCFDCWPGGPVTPPPCVRCGSTRGYFSNGLCARCHHHAAPKLFGVDSCRDCYAWGAQRHNRWYCLGCANWRQERKVGQCRACKRKVPLDQNRYCRLCRRQRTYLVTDNRWGRIEDAIRFGHQLFLADMFTRVGQHTDYRRRTSDPVVVARVPVAHRQLTLFDWPRDMTNGRRRGFLDPPDEQLATFLLDFVEQRAASHGWHPSHTQAIRRGVRVLLAMQDTVGAPIRGSDLRWTTELGISNPALTEVLTAAGFFEEDREPPVVRWFRVQTADLPEPIRQELTVWFDIMINGSPRLPRRKPRDPSTTQSQLSYALPAIRDWARAVDSLREISRQDVADALPASGSRRTLILTALRSIFGILKARDMIFVNPTAWMHVHHSEFEIPPPIDLSALRAALDSDNPACAAVAALLAFHAIRVRQLRELLLTDLHDGRLHVGQRTIPLAKPVRDRLRAWLNYRQQRWPNTANPHLFVSYRSATRTHAVSIGWAQHQLGIPPQSIRQDRILDDAFATSGDMRQIIDLFGLSAAGAQRYTTVAVRAQRAADAPPDR